MISFSSRFFRPCLLSIYLWSIFLCQGAKSQIRLNPTILEAEAVQGQARGVINLSNPSTSPIRVRIFAQPFTYDRDTGFELDSSSPQDLSPYLFFSPREMVIPPSGTRRVRLITRLSPELPDGEYRTVIFTENLIKFQEDQGSSSTITARIGANVYVRKGNLSPQLNVESVSFDPKDQQVELLVKNAGNATAHIEVNWALYQADQQLDQGKVLLATLLAGHDRNVPLEFPPPLPKAGTYQLKGEILWGPFANRSKMPFAVPLTFPTDITATTQPPLSGE